jgi:hypothetical protein
MVDSNDDNRDVTLSLVLPSQDEGFTDSGAAVDAAWESLREAKRATDRLHRVLADCPPPDGHARTGAA